MFNYNPSLPHQTEAKHNVLQAVSARFPSLSAQISFELDLFAAQSEELNLCWEFHANTDYTGAVAERLEGIQTHFDTVLENLLQISEEIQSITLELVDLNLLQPGVGIRGSYEELQILLTEQIQIVEEAQADLENCSTLFELEHSGDATHYKDMINSHCERGLAPEEFRPFARMIIDVCRAEDTEAAFPQFYQKLLAFQPTTATTFRM